MGSSGSGNFGNYSGGGDQSLCDKTIEADLEDVATSPFYSKNGSLPAVGVPVSLVKTPQNGRFVVQEDATRTVLGVLPTEFNYVKVCLSQGKHFSGEVIEVSAGAIPRIRVRLEPIHGN